MAAAAAGLAAIMRANPLVFQALQWFGAAYLVWMGVHLIRARVDAAAQAQESERAAWSYLRQAMAVSLTNPICVSFFPLFLKPQASAATIGVMMLHVTLISLAYQAALVLLGNKVANALRGIPSARKIATRLAGVALIGFGLKLAVDNR